MKIALITFVTPASENIRGTSALPYHLIKGRSGTSYENEMLVLRNADATKKKTSETTYENEMLTLRNADATKNRTSEISYENEKINVNLNNNDNISFEIYTFNNNGLSDQKIAEVEKELNVTIKKVPLPRWYLWMFKLHLLFLRVFPRYPLANYIKLPKRYVDEINEQKPDLIWVMGEELSRIVKQFLGYQRIQIGPDTESLYYYRMMGQRFVMNNPLEYWKCALMYRKYARMERNFCTDDNFTYYAVGEEDVRHLKLLNPKEKAKFLRHPHYEVREHFVVNDNVNVNDNRRFHQPKIKLLIAGQYNLYMKQSADELLQYICRYEDETFHYENENHSTGFLQEHYSITFLGKVWEKHVETLKDAGYEVEHIMFAPDYIEEIVKHDIQITPIAIGTGTKGKVLDALANGLLVIGTSYAMENIAVKHGESCIEYRQPEEVIRVLMDIPNNRGKYERMAALGRQQVLEHHDRVKISKELFSSCLINS